METCRFCEIANKVIASEIIYETDFSLAFLDINPVSKRHTLVIPKNHFENIFDISEEILEDIINVSKKVSLRYKMNGVEGINLLHASGKAAQQSLFHFHIHIIPRYTNDGLDMWLKNAINDKL